MTNFSNILIKALNFILGGMVVLLGLRFLFKIVAANPNTPLVYWIYQASDVLITPFRGMFPNYLIGGGSIFETVTPITLIAYIILVFLLETLVETITKTTTEPHEHLIRHWH
ncbi:YggT family protein [Candidatus Microgenomates bacterium]|nr:YggT family protein [Candidatus Microgenomates bacterium]